MTEAEIVQQKIQPSEGQLEQPRTPHPIKVEKEMKSEKAAEKVEKVKKLEKPKADQIKRLENAVDAIAVAKKTKTVVQSKPEKKSTKPKKIISLRDLPVDEIYIPLKGPELDFEEIIRKASPNIKKKVEKPSTADEIFIPLHSPTKSHAEHDDGKAFADDVPSYSQGSPKTRTKVCTKQAFPSSQCEKSTEIHRKAKQETKMREYEVCEDGSIFIPLHSPNEEKKIKNFENDTESLNEKLGREAEFDSEKPRPEEDKQVKPATLDLSDSSLNAASRLSQTLPAGRSGKYFFI